MSKKNKLTEKHFKTYNMLDTRCGELHKLIRAEKDKVILLGYFDELIRTYDKMSSMVRPSWMERIAIKQLVKTRDALRRSNHQYRPRDAPSDAEIESALKDKDKLKEMVKDA